MKTQLLMAAVAVTFVGCGTTSMTRLGSGQHAAKPETCEIQVLTSAPTDRKYEELAIVQAATGQTIFHGKDLNAMLPGMKKQACSLGADALIVKDVQAGGIPWIQATQGRASGVAIRYTETQ